MATTFDTVDAYIATQPEAIRARLAEIRRVVREIAPDAKESISYGMPAYRLNGPLVYFGAYKQHIGMYPVPVDAEFRAAIAPYLTHTSTARFPHTKPLPMALIARLVDLNRQAAGASPVPSR